MTGASLRLADDDGAPAVALSVSPSTISEAGGTASVSAALAYAWRVPGAVTVRAAPGAYSVGSDATITIAAGSLTSPDRVTITAADNTRHEAPRSATVTGTAGAFHVNGAALTITDDDVPTVTLALSSASMTESGASNSATVTASLDRASPVDTTVTVSATPGTNAQSSDYTLSGQRVLTIPAGSRTSTGAVTVTAADNALDEPDKRVTVWATAANRLGVTPPAATSLTITDDDPTPSLSISSPTVLEGDSGSASLNYAVTLSAASGRRVTVNYADAGTGTAASGTDYTALAAGTLTVAAGVGRGTITVSVTGDTTDDPDETVVVTLGSASAGATIGLEVAGGLRLADGAGRVEVETRPRGMRDPSRREMRVGIRLR